MSDEAQTGILLHLARVTLEARTPLSIGGTGDALFDIVLARDVNGLPCIPGTSVQGAVRHHWRDLYGDGLEVSLLGTGDKGAERTGKVTFGWGYVHDQTDTAVIGLHSQAPDFKDPILGRLAEEAPLRRDHIALDDRHTAAGRGKHERAAAPRGTRFSMQLTLWGTPAAKAAEWEDIERLVALIGHRAFRLGGSTGRGYGAIDIVRASYEAVVLGADGSGFENLRRIRAEPPSVPLAEDITWKLKEQDHEDIVSATLILQPSGLWRVGQTGAPQTDRHRVPQGANPRSKPVDHAPVREARIAWSGSQGEWHEPDRNCFVVPGAGVRGAVAHRALFHWNCNNGRLVDADQDNAIDPAFRSRPESLTRLFGAIIEDGAAESRASRLIVEDTEVAAPHIQALDHNSIDRFTGGVRNRILFSEEAVIGGSVEMPLIIRLPHCRDGRNGEFGGWPSDVVEAFLAALDDLCSGRLALGAKSMGVASGNVIWGGALSLKTEWEAAWRKQRSQGGRP